MSTEIHGESESPEDGIQKIKMKINKPKYYGHEKAINQTPSQRDMTYYRKNEGDSENRKKCRRKKYPATRVSK